MTVILTLGFINNIGAGADPQNKKQSSTLTQMQDLAHKAEVTSEALLNNKLKMEKVDKRIIRADKELKRATQEHKKAEVRRHAIQRHINIIARRNVTSSPVSNLGALLVSQSPTELLNRVQIQSMLSSAMAQTVRRREKAIEDTKNFENLARTARKEGEKARKEALAERKQLNKNRIELRSKIAEVRAKFNALSSSERRQWISIDIPEGFDPSIAFGTNELGNRALRAAITRIGSPYVWGATGPGSFDCSGLMFWAYKQIGINIPRTSEAQLAGGKHINRQDAQPGDLVIFYPGASHVGMYAGEGKVLHAPDFGRPVQVSPIDSMPFLDIVRY